MVSAHELPVAVALLLLLVAWICFVTVAAWFFVKWKKNLCLDLEYLENYASSIHYGLVEMGGFRRLGQMTAQQRLYMCVREQANIECHTTMGPEKYMHYVEYHQMETNQRKKQRKRRQSRIK